MFVEADKQVYQINYITGEYIIHGTSSKKPDPIIKETPKKEIKEKVIEIKLNRNDICSCGSGLKYKKCCINKK